MVTNRNPYSVRAINDASVSFYAVPAFGSLDELEELRLASAAEYEVAEKCALRLLGKQF